MADHMFLNFEAASRQLGISSRTLHRWVNRGMVPVVDDGSGRRLVDLEAARVFAARPRTSLSVLGDSAARQAAGDDLDMSHPTARVATNVDTRLAALEERVTVLEQLVGIEPPTDGPAPCP